MHFAHEILIDLRNLQSNLIDLGPFFFKSSSCKIHDFILKFFGQTTFNLRQMAFEPNW
jgi:hypothetical protein